MRFWPCSVKMKGNCLELFIQNRSFSQKGQNNQ
uniref:Uncharacterized protein n=1 Tax=Arundo donax TaxID=35708 RepID=A0A0A8YKC5_ARUDO